MREALKLILSGSIIVLFIFLSSLAFSFSLNNDGYIHFLKDHFVEDISDLEGQFIGFKADLISPEKELRSTYGNYSVLYSKLDYQNYECRGSGEDESCSWHTYKTESYATPFTVDVNNLSISITSILEIEFIPTTTETYDKSSKHRVLQSVIKTSNSVYIWGYVENNEITSYEDTEHDKTIFIVTDSAKQTLIDLVSSVLFGEFLSAGLIVLMIFLLYLVNRNWKQHSYIGGNKQSSNILRGLQINSLTPRPLVPPGIKIISHLYYLGAFLGIVLSLIFGLGLILFVLIGKTNLFIGALGVGFFFLGGLCVIGLSILSYAVGKGLLEIKHWARIVAIVISGLGVLGAILLLIRGNMILSLFGFMIHLSIGAYLLLSKKVKETFT